MTPLIQAHPVWTHHPSVAQKMNGAPWERPMPCRPPLLLDHFVKIQDMLVHSQHSLSCLTKKLGGSSWLFPFLFPLLPESPTVCPLCLGKCLKPCRVSLGLDSHPHPPKSGHVLSLQTFLQIGGWLPVEPSFRPSWPLHPLTAALQMAESFLRFLGLYHLVIVLVCGCCFIRPPLPLDLELGSNLAPLGSPSTGPDLNGGSIFPCVFLGPAERQDASPHPTPIGADLPSLTGLLVSSKISSSYSSLSPRQPQHPWGGCQAARPLLS